MFSYSTLTKPVKEVKEHLELRGDMVGYQKMGPHTYGAGPGPIGAGDS